jgi:DNA helicase IV
MELRRARRGPNAGNDFWGCATFPQCRGTRDVAVQKKRDLDAPTSETISTTRSGDHPDMQSEQERIHYFYDCLETMRGAAERQIADGAGADPVATDLIKEMAFRRLERLSDDMGLVRSRIDPDGDDPIYIGKVGVFDGDLIVLVDWRARAAEPYFEASPDDPKGLLARRAFSTDRRTLLGIAEERFDGREATAVPMGIDDLLLEELARGRGDRMREIVATIRADQNRLMRMPMNEVLVIQGAPGSGKTAIGLHRAAWLLYHHQEDLSRSGVLVVGPTAVFLQYVSDVLPSLGEEAVTYLAPQDLVPDIPMRADERPEVARIKGDIRMAEVVKRDLWSRLRVPAEPIRVEAHGRTTTLSVEAVADAVSRAREGEPSFHSARRRFSVFLETAHREQLERDDEQLRDETEAAAAMVERRRAERIKGDRLQTVANRVWPSVTAVEIVAGLLASGPRLAQAGEGLFSEDALELLYRPGRSRNRENAWTEHDLPLLAEAQALLGVETSSYGHLILDEAQDLTPMQLRAIGRRARRSSVTVLGDLAQATGTFAYVSWDEVIDHLGHGSAGIEQLTNGYRVPRQTMDLALPTLHATGLELAEPVAFREGKEPTISETARVALSEEVAFETLAAMEAGGSVGVIVPETLVAEVRGAFDKNEMPFAEASRGEFGTAVDLLVPQLVKGLEFDHVVLVEPLAILRESPAQDPLRELFVALTRSTKTLSILHSEPLPRVLGGDAEIPTSRLTLAEKHEETRIEEPVRLSPRTSDALAYARLLGGRDSSTSRAVERGLAIAGLLLSTGATEEQAIAALVQAVVAAGDDVRLAEVRMLFGPAVADELAAQAEEGAGARIRVVGELYDELIAALKRVGEPEVLERLRSK